MAETTRDAAWNTKPPVTGAPGHQMSTGKATMLSASTFSWGTNSSRGSGVRGLAGRPVRPARRRRRSAGLLGAQQAGSAEPALASVSSRAASVISETARHSCSFMYSLRVAGDAKADVGAGLRSVVAVAEPQLADRALQEARAEDHVQVAARGSDRVALDAARRRGGIA